MRDLSHRRLEKVSTLAGRPAGLRNLVQDVGHEDAAVFLPVRRWNVRLRDLSLGLPVFFVPVYRYFEYRYTGT